MYVIVDKEEYETNKGSQKYEISVDCNGNMVFIKRVVGAYENA